METEVAIKSKAFKSSNGWKQVYLVPTTTASKPTIFRIQAKGVE